MNIHPGSKVRMRLTWSSACLNHHHIYTVLRFTEDNKHEQVFLEGITGGPFNVDAFEVVPEEQLSNQVVFKGTGKPHPSKEEEWQAKWLQLTYPFMLIAGQTYTVKRRETIKREALVLEGYENCRFDTRFFANAVVTNTALFNPTIVAQEKSMEPHQERVIMEEAELGEKMEKLHVFLESEKFKNLDYAERTRLTLQLRAMKRYDEILKERIVAFGIEADPVQKVQESLGLQDEEREVLELLSIAWDKWIVLEGSSDDDIDEFRHCVHRMQYIVGMRVARRANPKDWN